MWKGVSAGGRSGEHAGALGGGAVGEVPIDFEPGCYRKPRIVDVDWEDWDEVANMDPQGDELDRLCDQHPSPPDWRDT